LDVSQKKQMLRFDLAPLEAAGPIEFGMARRDVAARLNLPSRPFKKAATSKHPTDAFLDSCLQVFYKGDEPVVDYIEFSRCAALSVVYKGIGLFEVPAKEMIQRLELEGDFDCDSEEDPTDLIFPDLSLSFWRPTPEGPYFSTIGLGSVGYYDVT
jgi:hypothetical protein